MTRPPSLTMRESSNEQDTPDTTGETAVQDRPSRSILKRLRVERVATSVVHPLMVDHHYLQSMPAAPRRCYGVYLDGVLLGGVVFTSGARHGHRLLTAARPDEVTTLARLWLSDDLPANSESRVLGIVLRDLRRTTSWKLLLSYADPTVGHVGIIYQASGWIYLGQTVGETYVRLADGRLHHPRSVYSRYGSNRISHLQATGVPAQRESVGGKHRYAYVLDPAWTWRLRSVQQPGLSRPRPPPGQSTCHRTSDTTKRPGSVSSTLPGQKETVMIASRDILPATDAPPPGRIYIASPMTTYRTNRYDKKVAEIGERYPRAQLLLARDLYRSNAEWQRRWPSIIPTLTEFVFFAEHDGTIGLGVWSELHDVAGQMPVWSLDDAGWQPLANVEIDILGESMTRFARVVAPVTANRAADA